jgi:hypothetical protein
MAERRELIFNAGMRATAFARDNYDPKDHNPDLTEDMKKLIFTSWDTLNESPNAFQKSVLALTR